MAVKADQSLLDAAVMETLANDPTLMSYVTGVYWAIAPEGSLKFVVVSLSHFERVPAFDDGRGEDAIERTLYLVKVTMHQTGDTATAIRDAAARVHDLLHHAELDLSSPPDVLMQCARIDRVRYTEPEPTDPGAQRWYHRGGLYEVAVSV